MGKISEDDLRNIQKEVAVEFPNDPALQSVHVSRKILVKEAELEGLNLVEYIISLRVTDGAQK